MKISVVIAYHDEKQYIKDCLASLAEQTFQDFEVILVCDGCEAPEEGIPETLNIVTVMQEEKGVAGARNAGIEKAQGEYVVFLVFAIRYSYGFSGSTLVSSPSSPLVSFCSSNFSPLS